ncbi:MAG: alginate export family protein [Tepidisphaera sp.]
MNTSPVSSLPRIAGLAIGASIFASLLATVASAQPASPPAPSDPAAKPAPASPPAPPPFKLFRYEDDFSSFADPAKRSGFFDDIKYISLEDQSPITLSLGGELRSRYEYSSAPLFGLRRPGHDDFFLQRFLLHADLHVGKYEELHGRAFVQIASGLVFGEEFPKAGNQDNALDVQQAFGEVNWGDNRAPALASGGSAFSIRAGRQEMGFGSFRLVTIREPTNSRLAFDGVRATWNVDRMTFDAFLVRPADTKPGVFNDGEDDNTTFWGLHSSFPLAPERKLGVDFYYFGLSRENTRFQSGVGDELRHSVGARLWGRDNGWDHDTEAVFQFGTFDRVSASEDIIAWTIASNTGYTFESSSLKPRIGLKLNYASGDEDPTDGTLGTFNPLFPRNNYFSDANLLAPYNFFDIHPTFAIKPVQSLTLTAGFDIFFRTSEDDAVFSPTGIVIAGPASDSRFVGSTLNIAADWAINRHLTLSGSFAHFFRGDVVSDAGGKDVDYFGLWLTAKF